MFVVYRCESSVFKDVFQKMRNQNPSNASQFIPFYFVLVGIFNHLSMQFFIINSIALPAKSVLGKFLNIDFLDRITSRVSFLPFGHW